MDQKTVTICIVEDDDDIRQLTKAVVELSGNIIFTHEFANAEEFLKQANDLVVDIILMDIGLPGISGIECVSRCISDGLELNFIMYTTHFDASDVFEALKAGAKGYILKGGPPAKLIEDIYEMASGGSPMSPQISRLVIDSFHKSGKSSNDLTSLTKQEWEVLSGLEKGLTYKEIAGQKFVSAHTVRAQIRSIYEKLHVHNKVEAVKFYQKSR